MARKTVHPPGCTCCIWIKHLQPGDVLKTKSGALRVCRYVHHQGESIPKTWVMFTIRHKSWTNRPYTMMNGNDLRTAGYKPTGARYPVDDRFNRIFLEEKKAPRARDCSFRPEDVAGIP